jgi:hypothetical protein
MTTDEYPLLAEFTAYIRRPEPLINGVRARLYAENGADADAILTLARSAYQDALVDVALHDGSTDGEDESGGFQGYIRRPKPTQSGMTALFYAENGEAADAVTAMSLSKYLDSRVHVVVRLVQSQDGESQARKKQPKGPHSDAARDLWKSGFFLSAPVRKALGCGPPQQSGYAAQRDAWDTWVAQHGYESMTHVPPTELARWARRHGVDKYLPLIYSMDDEFHRMEV